MWLEHMAIDSMRSFWSGTIRLELQIIVMNIVFQCTDLVLLMLDDLYERLELHVVQWALLRDNSVRRIIRNAGCFTPGWQFAVKKREEGVKTGGGFSRSCGRLL